MNYLTLILQAQSGTTAAKGGNTLFLIVILLVFVVMWFFMIRPQQKKQKELVKFRESLKKGDRIVTVGGIYGTVSEVKGNVLIIEIDSNVKIRVDKASVVKDFSDAQ